MQSAGQPVIESETDTAEASATSPSREVGQEALATADKPAGYEIHFEARPPRPHAELSAVEEAEDLAEDLIESGIVQGHIRVVHAEPGTGMPAPSGEHSPWLLQWMDTDPVTLAPMLFNCSVAELTRAWNAAPQGSWLKDFGARTLRRVSP